jgi:hypothetical protein
MLASSGKSSLTAFRTMVNPEILTSQRLTKSWWSFPVGANLAARFGQGNVQPSAKENGLIQVDCALDRA